MKSVSIALVVHGWPAEKFGGVGLYVLALAKELHRQHHDVTILSPKQSTAYAICETPTEWGRHLSISIPLAKNWKETWSRDANTLQTLLKPYRFDVVHIHHLGNWPLLLPKLISAPVRILTLHDYAIICIRGQLYHPQHGICSGPAPEKCMACIRSHLAHHPLFYRISKYTPARVTNRIKKWIAKLPTSSHQNWIQDRIQASSDCLEGFDLILSPSHDLINRMSVFSASAISYDPLPLLSPLERRGSLPSTPYCFLFASSIIPTKGLHLVLDVMKHLPNAQLLVAGSGFPFDGWPNYEKDQIQRCHALPNVKYLGAIPHDQMAEVLSQAHCLVLPSLWPENSPIIVREALSLGLSVICSKEGGARELSHTIHTISPYDHHDLLITMKRLSHSPASKEIHHFLTIEEHVYALSQRYLGNRFAN